MILYKHHAAMLSSASQTCPSQRLASCVEHCKQPAVATVALPLRFSNCAGWDMSDRICNSNACQHWSSFMQRQTTSEGNKEGLQPGSQGPFSFQKHKSRGFEECRPEACACLYICYICPWWFTRTTHSRGSERMIYMKLGSHTGCSCS